MNKPHSSMPMLRTIHLAIGTLTLVLFILTGQYMHWVHNHLENMAEGPRLFLRSAHIYLLWSAIANLLLGIYLQRVAAGFIRQLQTVSSLLLVAASPMLAYSFFCEAYNADLQRTVGWWANIFGFIGVLGQLCIGMTSRRRGGF